MIDPDLRERLSQIQEQLATRLSGVDPHQRLTGRPVSYRIIGGRPMVIAKGPDTTSSVGVITGAGGSMIRDAVDAGIDTLITGEGAHHTFFDAEEWGVNLIYAGHYATETLGVKALARHLAGRYELEWEFFDHPTGL